VSRGKCRSTMPRVQKTKFRRGRARVNWERSSGGRLLRLDNAAHYVDSDILVYDIDGVNAVAVAQHTICKTLCRGSYTIGQRIPPLPPPHSEFTKSTDIFNFEKLERHNMLEPILEFLGVSDIEALGKASSFLSNYIDQHYLLRLSLPLPPAMSEKLENRKVLALTSCCNLAWLPGIRIFQPFNQLNLTKLRELKLIGKNLNVHAYLELNQAYHTSLQHLLKSLSKTATLKKLEILTDSTSHSVDTAAMINNLVNLEELVLHGIGHFNSSALYQVDVGIANLIIQKALLNTTISVLHLIRFNAHEHHESNTLVVHSQRLKQMSILECKVIKLDLVLPSLTSLETEISTYIFDHYIDKQMKQMVETNCPLLCTWNGVNVKEVAKKAGAGNWAEHLTFPEPSWA